MEIFGGFMVMTSILGLFLAVIWLVMPFVVFAIKGKQDRMLEVLEGIESRLAALEQQLAASSRDDAPPVVSSQPQHEEDHLTEERHDVTATG